MSGPENLVAECWQGESIAPLKECCDMATTINQQLARRKTRLTTELAQVDAAIEALEKNPGVAEVLNTVGKAIGRL